MKQTWTVRICVGQVAGELPVKNLLLGLWSLLHRPVMAEHYEKSDYYKDTMENRGLFVNPDIIYANKGF